MRRQNLQPRRMHVHKSHHDFFGILQSRILVAKRQRGLVAMMPIGDQQLLVRHQRLNLARSLPDRKSSKRDASRRIRPLAL